MERHNAGMYERKGVKRDRKVHGWNRRQSSLHTWCPGYDDPEEIPDMSLHFH